FSSRRRHTRSLRDWSSDVCSSDLNTLVVDAATGINLSGSLAFLRDLTSATGGIDITSTSGVLNLYGSINSGLAGTTLSAAGITRSEERRVGKECEERWPGGRTCGT